MGQILLIALSTLASEDLTCIATGGLISAGKIGFARGVLACLIGIFVGDLMLYFGGRVVGRPIANWGPLRKILTGPKIDKASQWLAERGASVVILSRFTPGLRLPVYIAAGVLETSFWTFAAYFLLAALLWTPALVGAAALLGKSLPRVMWFGPALVVAAREFRGKR
jgi:membrane protein DedA with SNARE-associated domain